MDPIKNLYRILGTKPYLSKVNLRQDASCFRCRNEMENIKENIKSKVTTTLSVTPFNITLGYTLAEVNQQPINTILLVAKNIYI